MKAALVVRRPASYPRLDFGSSGHIEAMSLLAGAVAWQLFGVFAHQSWLPPLTGVIGKL